MSFLQGMTGVPGFSGSDGIPVSHFIGLHSTYLMSHGLSFYIDLIWLCRATQDRQGHGGNQVLTDAMGLTEIRAYQDYQDKMADLVFL